MILYFFFVSVNFLYYGRELTVLDNLDFGSLYLDIEDSSFINNITFGMKTVQVVVRQTFYFLFFYFMFVRLQRWFNALVEIRFAWIFVYVETLDYFSETLIEIRYIGVRVGLVFNSVISIDVWRYLAFELDGVMVMISEFDGQGQRFIFFMCEKI